MLSRSPWLCQFSETASNQSVVCFDTTSLGSGMNQLYYFGTALMLFEGGTQKGRNLAVASICTGGRSNKEKIRSLHPNLVQDPENHRCGFSTLISKHEPYHLGDASLLPNPPRGLRTLRSVPACGMRSNYFNATPPTSACRRHNPVTLIAERGGEGGVTQHPPPMGGCRYSVLPQDRMICPLHVLQ